MGQTSRRFTLELPKGWEDETIYIYKGPDDSGVQHRITLSIDRATRASSVEEFARARIDSALATLQGVEILKEGAKELESGRPAYECVYRWIPAGSDALFVRNVYLLEDGAGYAFSGAFSKKTLKTIGVEMDSIVESFDPRGAE